MKQIFLSAALIAVPVAGFTAVELMTASAGSARATASLGDLSSFQAIIADVQTDVGKGDMAAAVKRITDYESAWDQGEAAIRPMNPTYWGNVDAASDTALKATRQSSTSPDRVNAALSELMAVLNDPSKAPQQ